MTEITTKCPTQRKVDEGAAMAALSKLSAKLSDMKRAKREAEEAERLAKREARKGSLLAVLHTGKPTTKSDVWCVRFALSKAVTAVKLGATAEELLGCEALQAVAPWGDLEQAVTEYAAAKCANVAAVLTGLGRGAKGEPEPAEETPATDTAPDSPQDAVSPAEPPKARTARKTRPRSRKEA